MKAAIAGLEAALKVIMAGSTKGMTAEEVRAVHMERRVAILDAFADVDDFVSKKLGAAELKAEAMALRDGIDTEHLDNEIHDPARIGYPLPEVQKVSKSGLSTKKK